MQGRGPGGLILDHSEARRAEKIFLAHRPPPLPRSTLYVKVWIRHCLRHTDGTKLSLRRFFLCKVTPRVTPSRERRVRLQAASHQPRLFSYRPNLLL